MVVKKKIMEIDGKQVEVEVFETEIIPGKNEDEAISELLREEEIEKTVLDAVRQIDDIFKEYANRDRDIWYRYRIGKVLLFVDKKGFEKEKPRIWERIAADLRPTVFFGKDKPPKKASRYPEYMYRLAKQRKQNVGKLTWSHWFEILQYPNIYGCEKALQQLISEHVRNNLSRDELRERTLELNNELNAAVANNRSRSRTVQHPLDVHENRAR